MATSSTRISLNDRFTIMQTVGGPNGSGNGPSAGPPMMRRPRSRSRSRSQSRSRSVNRMPPMSPQRSPRMQALAPEPRSRLARHYEDIIERPQFSRGIQRPSAMRNLSGKQRLAMAMASRGVGRTMGTLRAAGRPARRLPGARAALATMRMDQLAVRGGPRAAATLRARRLNRAIATVNEARLKRVGGGAVASAAGNRRLSRIDLQRSLSKANLIRQRSRSRSKSNMALPQQLRRSNSRLNLNQGSQGQGQGQRRKLNRDFQQRSRSRSRANAAPSIASRLGVRPGNQTNNNNSPQNARGRSRQRGNSIASRLGNQGKLNRVAQGRVSKQQRLGRLPKGQQQQMQQQQRNGNNNNNNKKRSQSVNRNGKQVQKQGNQGARGNQGAQGVRGKKNLNNKPSALQQRLQKGVNKIKKQQQKGGQQKQQQQQKQQPGQGKARRGKRGTPKRPLKKEDLDKELDKYMSTNN